MSYHTEIGLGSSHILFNDIAQPYQATKTMSQWHLNIGMIMIGCIQLERGFRNKFAFKSDYPQIALSIFQHGYGTMDLAFGYKTYVRGFECGRLKIDKMLQFPLHAYDQLLIIVLMRLVRCCGDRTRFGRPHFKYFKELFHKFLKIFSLERWQTSNVDKPMKFKCS